MSHDAHANFRISEVCPPGKMVAEPFIDNAVLPTGAKRPSKPNGRAFSVYLSWRYTHMYNRIKKTVEMVFTVLSYQMSIYLLYDDLPRLIYL